MKLYCVNYSYRTRFDATVEANSKKEAEEKVKEFIGDCRLEGTWEIKNEDVKD